MLKRLFPFNPFVVPSSFFDSWTVAQQIEYLAKNKQNKLVAGDGIKLTLNQDGTYTISLDREENENDS